MVNVTFLGRFTEKEEREEHIKSEKKTAEIMEVSEGKKTRLGKRL